MLLRPYFKSKTISGQPSTIEEKLEDPDVLARMTAMEESLKQAIIEEAEEGLSAVGRPKAF